MTTPRERLTPQVHEAYDAGELARLRLLLADHHPADLADLLERLEAAQLFQIFQLLDDELAASVLDEIGRDATRTLLDRLPVEEAAELLGRLPMDDAAEILVEDVPEQQDELLAAMDKHEAASVRRLLRYPADSAGQLMTEQFVSLQPQMSATEALAQVRSMDDDAETVSDLYVQDDEGRLLGVLSLRELINLPAQARVADHMTTRVVSVHPETDQEHVAREVAQYNFLAIPVVDSERKLLGIITVDDVIDVLVKENTEDILRFGAVERGSVDQPYFTVPLLRVLRNRFGWLLLLMVADTLTGAVLRQFSTRLAAVVQLSFYIPLLIGTGGNTGAQTVSTIIRGLAVRDIHFSDLWRVLRRELLGGLLLGLALSLVAGTRAWLWDGDLRLSLVIGISIVTICTWANVMGSLIPMLANRFGVDAAVVSAPMISTLVDASGLFIYLSIAGLLLTGNL